MRTRYGNLEIEIDPKTGRGRLVKANTAAGGARRTPPAGPSLDAPRQWSLVLCGQMPSGKNRTKIRRDGHHYPEERFVIWRTDMLAQLAKQWREEPIATPVRLQCEYWPGDRRTRDVSGMTDALFHLLVKARILEDDGLVHDLIWLRQPQNKKDPRLQFTLTEQEVHDGGT